MRTEESKINGICIQYSAPDRFLTCGDDGTVRIWSIQEKRCLFVIDLNIDQQGMVLSLDPNTKQIREVSRLTSIDVDFTSSFAAVGCFDGSVRIINMTSFTQITFFKHRKKAIKEVEFSPDGHILAVGDSEGNLDLYLVPTFKPSFKLKRSTSEICHIDWSTDSRYIQMQDMDSNLYYFDAQKGVPLPEGAKQLRDEKWKYSICTIGWPIQGIYQPNMLNATYICADRSPERLSGLSQMIAVGDTMSFIRVFRYPCIRIDAKYLELRGHSGPITALTFNEAGTHLLTIGGSDRCVMIWKISPST